MPADSDARPAGDGPDPEPHRRRRIRPWMVAVATVLVVAGGVGLVLFEPWRLWTRNTVDEPIPQAVAASEPARVTVPALDGNSGSEESRPRLSEPSTTVQIASSAPTEPSATSNPVSSEPAPSKPAPSKPVVSTQVPSAPASSPSVTRPPTAPSSAPAEPAPPAEPPAEPSVESQTPAPPQVLAEGEFVSQEHETSGMARVLLLADGSRYLRLEGLSSSDGPDLHVALTDQQAGGDWGKYRDGIYLHLGELKGTDGNQNYAIPADADLSALTSAVIWCDRFSVAFGSAPLSL